MDVKGEKHCSSLDEIKYYLTITSQNDDPIKKTVFNYKQLSKIFSKLNQFPILKEVYYHLFEENEKLFCKYVVASYLKSVEARDNLQHKGKIDKDQWTLLEDFIFQFYELENPVNDIHNEKIFWIYPKIEYKVFLCRCVNNSNLNDYFADSATLSKLVQIIIGFTKYESDETDDIIVPEVNLINFPSLVLANIYLYEKGFLELSESAKGISISINLKPHISFPKVFTNNVSLIKDMIIETCRKNYGEKYTYKDFIN